jgi:Protein of unknown function (DUF3574)
MKRRMLAGLGAVTILAGILAAAPERVSAQSGSRFEKLSEGDETATDPCLLTNSNAVTSAASSPDFATWRGFGGRRRPIPVDPSMGATAFARTELFFGTEKPDGSAVTDEEFRAFLDSQITPRFPDGLTLLKGDGQFRNSEGLIIKEESFVLILLYPVETFRDSSKRIESIRRCYLKTFQQESVLRADDPFASWVSF